MHLVVEPEMPNSRIPSIAMICGWCQAATLHLMLAKQELSKAVKLIRPTLALVPVSLVSNRVCGIRGSFSYLPPSK